jgi:hypothetical protein
MPILVDDAMPHPTPPTQRHHLPFPCRAGLQCAYKSGSHDEPEDQQKRHARTQQNERVHEKSNFFFWRPGRKVEATTKVALLLPAPWSAPNPKLSTASNNTKLVHRRRLVIKHLNIKHRQRAIIKRHQLLVPPSICSVHFGDKIRGSVWRTIDSRFM